MQLRHTLGRENFFSISVSYVPIINGEEKTKPTQHAVKQMRSAGLIPDMVCLVGTFSEWSGRILDLTFPSDRLPLRAGAR